MLRMKTSSGGKFEKVVEDWKGFEAVDFKRNLWELQFLPVAAAHSLS